MTTWLTLGLILEIVGVLMITIPALKGVNEILSERGYTLRHLKTGGLFGGLKDVLDGEEVEKSEHKEEETGKHEADKLVTKMWIIRFGVVILIVGLLIQIADSV